MTSRYLLYKDYESGLNNNLMGLEIAIGIAYLTQRKLVFYGSVGDDKTLLPVRGGHYFSVPESRRQIINNERFPTILDIVDQLPIQILTYSEFLQETFQQRLTFYDSSVRLVNAVFIANPETVNPDFLAEFSEGRILLQDVEADILHFHACNLAYYSRFFYLPSLSLYSLMEAIQPKLIYQNLADKICRTLGKFNGVHIRLTDYRKSILHTEAEHPYIILNTLLELFSPEELLVICTDESENLDFFIPILKVYKNVVFLDHYLIQHFKYDFKDLPFTDEQTLGLICNLVMASSQQFAGSFRSTYTGIIHRNWLRKQVNFNPNFSKLTFKFIDSGLSPEEATFKQGYFVEMRSGSFSWNRVHLSVPSEMKSWCREWPESVCLTF